MHSNQSNQIESLLSFSYSHSQLLYEYFLRRVVGKIQLIEAGMGPGQFGYIKVFVNVEFLGTIHSSQSFEPV